MSETYPSEMRAQAFFKTGNDAAQKSNFDYAIQMYQEACKLDLGNIVYRQALRSIERRKFNNNPASVGRLVGARNQPIRLRAKTAKAKGHWAHVLEVCEDAFAHNPWDSAAAEDAADAAEKLGLKELAEWLMESVAAQAGDHTGFFRHQARVHELNEHWQKAIQCWERVKKIDPTDEEAGRQINSLSANATIARSGLHEAIERASSSSAPESFAPDAEDLKQMAMAPEERWRKEIEDDPQRIRAYLELTDHLRLHDRLDDAEKVLALGLKNNPGDTILQTQHAEIQISRIHKRIDALTQRAQADPSDGDSRAKLGQLTAKLHEYEIKEYRRRLGLRPEDLNLRFELGVRLARAAQHDAAIGEFQQARNLPTLKVKALLESGKSFEAKGLIKLAERSFNDALKALETSDPEDQETINALHYQLGRVAESQGNVLAAEEHYNEVAANDYSYRDVAERLRNLNPGG